ncbi:MAG: site-specific DNA-methyltransferase [Verrucomicrobiota bacterium]|jgi:DNA modification methylase
MSKAELNGKPASTPAIEVGGQIVYYGNSEQMCGIADESVQLIVTSPPYWNLKRYGQKPEQIGSEEYETYLNRMSRVWSECYRVAKPGGVLVINVNSRRNKGVLYPIAFDIYRTIQSWKLWDINIWYIPNALPQPNHYMERLFDNKFEYLLVFLKGSSDQYKFRKPRVPQKYIDADPRSHKKNERGRCLGNVIRIPAYRPPNVKQLGYHEAAFPEELVALMVETYTDSGDSVVDPFLGSGTTLKVCRVMSRRGIGYELNEGYGDLIKKRICEPWAVPDWRKIDLLHSTTMETGMKGTRKIHFLSRGMLQPELI